MRRWPVKSLTIAERLAAQDDWKTSNDLAREAWDRWRTARWFSGGSIRNWLTACGFDEQAFISALGAIDTVTSVPICKQFTADADHGLLSAVAPLAQRQSNEFWTSAHRRWGKVPWWPCAADLERIQVDLVQELHGRLGQIALRTTLLEFNVSQQRGELPGSTAEGQLSAFIDLIKAGPRLTALFDEYPVLWRQCDQECRRWAAGLAQMLQRLTQDSLEGHLGRPALRLTSISPALGDPHRGGQSVRRLEFAEGSRWVYKPRPLDGEQWFAEFVNWLQVREHTQHILLAKSVNRPEWGWQEWVEHLPCRSVDEVREFYSRFGWLMGVSHVLGISDMHQDNLIAHGANPVPIDLETIAHPPVGVFRRSTIVDKDEFIPQRHRTVLSTWMITVAQSEESDRPDASALLGGSRTVDGCNLYELVDETRVRSLNLKPHAPVSNANQPFLESGTPVNPMDYLNDVVQSFEQAYAHLLDRRSELLTEGSPLASFGEARLRYLPRSTRTYFTALNASYHPNLLRDAAERQLYLSHLWRDVELRPELANLISSEMDNLIDGDIPTFTFCPASTCLTNSRKESIDSFFQNSPAEQLEQHLHEMSPDGAKLQSWLIEAATRGTTGWPTSDRRTRERAQAVDPDSAVRGIIDWLRAHAFSGNDGTGTCWFGLPPATPGRYRPDYVDDYLYDGRIGIAIFLAAAGVVLDLPEAVADAHDISTGIANRVNESLACTQGAVIRAGAFDGLAGIAYGLTAVARISGSAAFAPVEQWASRLADSMHNCKQFDVVSGSAGIALVSAALVGVGIEAYGLTASAAADHLLRHAHLDEAGARWASCTTGFAHGNSGIAAALEVAGAITGNSSLIQLAADAINWENHTQARETLERETLPAGGVNRVGNGSATWCRGIPGIGLGRVLAKGEGDYQQRILDVRRARDSVLHGSACEGHGLCHGVLGNLEVLHLLDLADPEQRDPDAAPRLVAEVLAEANSVGWLTGHPLGVSTPGLMTGLAGLGYGILRALNPDRLPSVLALRL